MKNCYSISRLVLTSLLSILGLNTVAATFSDNLAPAIQIGPLAAPQQTATAGQITVGFADGVKMDVHGVGTLKGAVQFAQSHVTFAKDNETRVLPNIVQDRAALLMYFPADGDGPIKSLSVTAFNGGKELGTIGLASPENMPKSDQLNITSMKVEYSTKAWSALLPWSWLKPGLILKLKTSNGLEQTIGSIKFSAPSELVLQNIRIGMLTPPVAPTYLETDPAFAAVDYFQKIPISKLVVGQYSPVHLTKVTLANGTVYTSASTSNGDVYSGDLREQIGKTLISQGIHLANYGISSSGGSKHLQPLYYMKVVVHHSIGNYANGIKRHGLSGGAGYATLYDTRGNEFSHELGHNFGLGHYPKGIPGSVHSRTAGWGYDAARHRMIGNTDSSGRSASFTFVDGQKIDTFANHPYGKDAMAGGGPMGSISTYTQHTGFVAAFIQKSLESYGVVDPSSPSGYVKWNPQTLKMETLMDQNRRKPSSVGGPVVTLVGFYDPQQVLPSTIYPPMYGSYGMTYPLKAIDNNSVPSGCQLVVTPLLRAKNQIRLTQDLNGTRINANEMNKFHVNISPELLPAKLDIQCSKNDNWTTLATANINQSTIDWPQTTVVGREAGYGALANTNATIDSLVGSAAPLRTIEQLREMIGQKFGPIKSWTHNDNNAMAGQVFEYANPYNNGIMDYFILKSDGAYGYFPVNQTSNQNWKYIGSASGKIVNERIHPFDILKQKASSADELIRNYYSKNLQNWVWSESIWSNSQQGVVGNIYVYDNPHTRLREYFQLKTPNYGYFPTNGTSSVNWRYLANANQINSYKASSNRSAFEDDLKNWHGVSAFDSWSSSRTGVPGSLYFRDISGKRDYFSLKNQSYGWYPASQASNFDWEYLGTF